MLETFVTVALYALAFAGWVALGVLLAQGFSLNE